MVKNKNVAQNLTSRVPVIITAVSVVCWDCCLSAESVNVSQKKMYVDLCNDSTSSLIGLQEHHG